MRFGIYLAAQCYRQIGIKAVAKGNKQWQKRTVVSTIEKLAITARSYYHYRNSHQCRQWTAEHVSALHTSLEGRFNPHTIQL